MPTPEQLQDVQQGYDEMVQRGLFQKHPELQPLGHELRARGLVKDPTQGGLVPPAQPAGVPVLPDARGASLPSGGGIQSPQAAQEWGNFVQRYGMGDPSAPGHVPPGTQLQKEPAPAAGITLKPRPKAAPAIPPVQTPPVQASMMGVLPEEKDLHQANLEYNALPPALRSQTYTRAEFGPVSDKGLERTWALSRYAQKAAAIDQALKREKTSLNALGRQLAQRGGTAEEITVYRQRASAYEARATALRHNTSEWWALKHPDPSLTSEDRSARLFKLNNTLRFSEENGHDPERVMSFGPIEALVPGAAMREAMRRIPAARGELLLNGLAPRPLINPGRNPVERQQYTQQLADLRNKFQDYNERLTQAVQSVTAGEGLTPRGKADTVRIRREAEQHLLQSFTPWQRTIYPQFKQHVAFEALAANHAGVSDAFASEVTAFAVIGLLAPALAPRAEALVGKPLTTLLGRVLAKAGIEEQLARFGGRKLLDLAPAALKRYAIQRAPTAASHAAVGAVLGPASTAAAGAVSGQPPKEIARSAVQSIPEMATFGGLMSLLVPTIPPEHPTIKAAPGEPALTPNRMVVDGQPLHLRTAPPAELEQMQTNLAQRRQTGLAGHPEAVAEATLGAHLERHGKYLERQGIEFADAKETKRYKDVWGNMKDPQRAQYELLGREADRLRETNPDLAAKIDQAKLQANYDFNHRFRVREEARGLRDQKITGVGGPAQASLWRHLTEEEKAQLSKPAQRDLLLQDLSNSRQVLKLGSLPDREVGERSLERLQAEADRLYQQAEAAHHREIVAAAHDAVGPEPVEAPTVEAPPAPAETVPPPVAEAAPAPIETHSAPVEAPAPTEAPDLLKGRQLYRYEQEGVPLDTSKPHGVYYSVLERPEDSPHTDIGPVAHTAEPNAKNPLVVPDVRVTHARFGEFREGPASAGVSALKALVPEDEFNRLLKASKSELVEELGRRFPGPDYDRYYDSYELLEVYGAQLARKLGYDAILKRDAHFTPEQRQHGGKDFSEYVALAPESTSKNAQTPPTEQETASLAPPPEVKQIDSDATHVLAEGAKKAMLEAGVPENRIKYNKAEGRYVITGKVSEVLKKKLALAREIYENSTYAYTTPEGTTHHIKGLAISHGTEPIETPAEAAISEPTVQPPTKTELGTPGPEPSVPVVAARPTRGRKAGGSTEPTVSPSAGGRTAANAPEVREPAGEPTAGGEPASRYQPGTVLKKAETGLILRIDERLPDGRWKATVIEPGNLRFRKGQSIGPVPEKTLDEFKPTKQRGVLGTLKQQLKSEEGSFTPPERGKKGGEVEGYDPEKFFNPSAQEAYERNKVEAPPPTPWQKVTQAVSENVRAIANSFARAETHLPANDRRYDVVRMYLDYRKGSVPMSKLKAELQLGRAINGFTDDELKLFSEGWIALGAKEDIEHQYSKHIEDGKNPTDFKAIPPDGFTVQDVEDGFNKAVELMKGTGRVAQSLSKMHDLNQEIWDGFRQSYERTTGRKMDSNIFFYTRHLILDYDNKGNYIGPGRVQVKRPGFTQQRRWSSLAYSTDLIKATMEWMPKAIREQINLDLLHHADVEHNIAPGIAFERIKRDAPDVHAHLQALISKGQTPLDPNMMLKLGEMASKDFLPDTMGQKFRPVIDALHWYWQETQERGAAGMAPIQPMPQLKGDLTNYAQWLNERRAWRVPMKGNEIPPGYRAYSHDSLQRLFKVFTIPDRLGEEAMLQATGNLLQVPVERVRKQLAMGRNRPPMILPEELAKTFDEMGLQRPDNLDSRLGRLGKGLMQAFKLNAIFTPFRMVHQVGKTLVLHGGPILRKIPSALAPGNLLEASRQIRDVGVRKIAPTDPDVKAWVDRGGMGDTQYQFEGINVGDLGQFARPARDPLTAMGHGLVSTLRAPHDWRERVFRLSVFKETMKQMREDPHGLPKDFLASNPQEIRNLPTIEDRAYRLTEDLNIPYRRTSEAGRWIGGHLSPFWSVQEHLFRREVQFLRNAWDQPAINYALGRKLAGNSVGVARAMDIGKFALRMGAVTGLWAFGNKLTPQGAQAEDRMSLRDRFTPHITLSYDPKTDIAVVAPIHSNLFEAARWFGVDHWPEYWDDYVHGRKTPSEITQDMATDPVNEFYKTMGPQWKLPMEWVPGLKRFPDFRHPLPMHDRWEEVYRMVGLDGLYRLIYNINQRQVTPAERARDFFLSTRYIDLGESAYNDTRQSVDHFLTSKGMPRRGVTLGDDPRSLLLYRYRQALRVGDATSAFQYLTKGAFDKNIGLTGKNYVQAIANAEPLHALNPLHRPKMLREFLDNLPEDDRMRLEQAYYHWQKVYTPEADLKHLHTGNTLDLIRTMRNAVISDAHKHNPLQQLRTAPETRKEIQAVQHERALLKR